MDLFIYQPGCPTLGFREQFGEQRVTAMRSLFVSVTTRIHLNVVIMAAELLHATGGRVEQMEEQKRQMSGMQMSFFSTSANFSISAQLLKVSLGLSRTLKGGNHLLPSSSAMLSSEAIQLWHKA